MIASNTLFDSVGGFDEDSRDRVSKGQPFLAFYTRDAQCCHLADTTEPSMCGGDAALCQITLTTCYIIVIIRCYVTLSSWAIDNTRLQLDFDGPEDFIYSNYSHCNEWILIDSSALKHTEQYHGVDNEPLEFTQLTYSMTIRRRVGFYVYALIIPSILLSLLMPLTFWIPPSGDGRITLGICLLVGSRPTDHYFRSVCLSVCLFVCLFVQSFSQPSLIRLRSN